MANGFAVSPADEVLAESTQRLETAKGTGRSIFDAPRNEPAVLTPELQRTIEEVSDRYAVPVNVIMAMAERDSGFNAFARSSGPGPKTRGIIGLSDADVARSGVNPYVPDQAFDAAARKMRGFLDQGLTVPDAVRAHIAGSNRDAWGPQAETYAADVLARAKHYAQTLYAPPPPAPPPPPPAPPRDERSGIIKGIDDAGRSLVRGVSALANTPFEIASALGSETAEKLAAPVRAEIETHRKGDSSELNAAREVLEKTGGRIAKRQQEAKAIGLKGWAGTILDNPMDAIADFGEVAGTIAASPRLMSSMAAESLPSMIAIGMTGRVAGAIAEGSVAAQTAGVVAGSAALSAGSIAEGINEDVAKLSDFAVGKLAPGAATPDEARAMVRRGAFATVNTLVAAVAAGALDGIGPGVEKLMAGGFHASGGMLRSALKSAGTEALQETAQSGLESAGTALGKDTFQPDKNNYESMIRDMASGAMVGAGMGGVSGAVAGRRGEAPRPTSLPGAASSPAAPAPPSSPAPAPSNPPGAPIAAQTAPQAASAPIPAPAPAAPPAAPAGPLEAALNVGAPHIAPLARIAGGRVAATDEMGTRTGVIVSQDADGVMFESDDGELQEFANDEIASGKVIVQALAGSAPVAAPQPEPNVELAAPTPPPDAAVSALVPTPAVPITSPAVAEEPSPPLVAPAAASAPTPPPSPIEQAPPTEEGPKTLMVEPEAEKPGMRSSVSSGSMQPAQPPVPEPALAPALASVPAPEPAQPPVTRSVVPSAALEAMNEAELRARLKYLADQAKVNGGWSKRLFSERVKVEAAIDTRKIEGTAPVAKPAVEAVDQSASTIAPPTPAVEVDYDPAADVKWFGTREKAEAYIEKKKLGSTHEVRPFKRRFDVVEKSVQGSTAAPTQAPQAFKWTQIGTNTTGAALFEDANGVRSIVEDGVRETESVRIESGRRVSIDRSRRKGRFLTADESGVGAQVEREAEAHPQPDAQPRSATPPEPKIEEKPPVPAEPTPSPVYGATNTLVTKEQAAALRDRLKAKFAEQRRTASSGIDPETLSVGVQLAAYHLEAGARSFSAFAKAVADDLGATLKEIRPYLRAWYNGARDLMEDAGRDVAGFDSPDTVRAELAKLMEVEDGRPEPQGGSARALEGVPTEPVQGTGEVGQAGKQPERGSAADGKRDAQPPEERAARAGGVGDGEGAIPVPAGRADDGGRKPAGGAEVPSRGERGDQQDHERGGRGSLEAPNAPSHGQTAQTAGSDFAILDEDEIGVGGAKTKFRQNVAAVRLLRDLEKRNAKATRQEQAILANYVGWGGLPQAFARSDGVATKGWDREVAELSSVLSKAELAAAAASTRNAHYTSPEIIKAMWAVVERLGFTPGRVLEPSMGVGNFLGLMPKSLRSDSSLYGVELDHITGGIAKQLYPAAYIVSPMGFQDYTFKNGFFDLAIGNPPFGSEKLYDPKNRALAKFSIHNYFFARSLDGLRPGGLLAMVVTNRMLDGARDDARSYMADRADLVAAIRLPNDAFLKNAGTSVTTDIIIMRRRAPGASPSGPAWADVGEYTDKNGAKVPLNEYFVANPQNMLGEFGAFGSMYRADDATLVPKAGQDTNDLLRQAILRIPSAQRAEVQPALVLPKPKAAPAPPSVPDVRVGSMFVKDGQVMIREPDQLGQRQAGKVDLAGTAQVRVVGMIGVRDAYAKLRDLQISSSSTDAQIDAARADLNKLYDAFVSEHGLLNIDVNRRLFQQDPGYPHLASLEDGFQKAVTPAAAATTGEKARPATARKSAVFSKRTQRPYTRPTSAASAKDAMIASLSEKGRVDLDYMRTLYGANDATMLAELGGLVFIDPVRGPVSREEYLSGNVKKKLAEAAESAKTDASFSRNVEALTAVQPSDISAIDINVKFGSHWIPRPVIQEFVSFISGESAARLSRKNIFYNPGNSKWSITTTSTPDAITRWATRRASVSDVLEAAANQSVITIRDKVDDRQILNQAETDAANAKVAAVEAEWQRWAMDDDARRDLLGRTYNDMFNTDRARKYDGSHLTLPGKVDDSIIALRPHQLDVIWRIVQSPTVLMDHVVGAGKTFAVVAAAMEMRRMGIAKKPMIVVPNHLVGQWGGDFSKLYPGSNVLSATKSDFEKQNRRKFFARIATGDWDAVIIAHSSFGMLEVEPEAQAAYIQQQVDDHIKTLSLVQEAAGEKAVGVKKINEAIAKLREKIKALINAGRKDDVIYWKELGVDALIVDEAHEFKNLAYSTSMNRVAGLGNPSGAQKASDLHLKASEIMRQTGGRNIVFATGTPISNTMAEMFTFQRYLDGKRLSEQGISHFDAWARTFGEVVTDWELTAAGQYKLKSRFSKFVNLPELMQRYTAFADVITRDDIRAQLALRGETLPIPGIKGGKPANVIVERSAHQADYIGVPIKVDGVETDRYPSGSLIWRSDNLPKGPPTKGADNALKIMGDARKAALDMRLIDPSLPDDPGSKTNRAVREIKARYDASSADKGAQLVFIDLSIPAGAQAKEAMRVRELMSAAESGDEAAREKIENMTPDEFDVLESKFSVYDDMKAKLIASGIPEAEIAFIHSANTDNQKGELFGKVRSGRVRVLLGSTAKMGAGMNVQERLVALHHIDAPWRPSDLEQREGRIIRQGNILFQRDPSFEVDVLRYATKQTLDSRMWQTLEGKARFIEQIRKGNDASRTADDVSSEASNSAEMKAAASGNPLILEEMTLRGEHRKLEREESAFRGDQYRVRDAIRFQEGATRSLEETLKKYVADAETATPDDFVVSIKGEEIDKRRDAGIAILKVLGEMAKSGAIRSEIGSYGGFKLTAYNDRGFFVGLKGASEHLTSIFNDSSDPQGVAQRIVTVARQIKDTDGIQRQIEESKETTGKLQKQLGAWPKFDDLTKVQAQHEEVLAKLKPKPKPEPEPEPPAGGKKSVGDIDAAGLSAEALESHLTRGADGHLIARLIERGQVVLHEVAGSVPEAAGTPPGRLRGVTTPDGVVHLVARNLDPQTARAVLLHEVFHAGVRPLIGDAPWNRTLARVQAAAETASSRVAQGTSDPRSEFWAGALARAEAAETPSAHLAEEVAAYAVENRELAPPGLREMIDALIGQAKAWLLRRLGAQVGAVSPAQLRALTISALRSWQGGATVSPRGIRYSMASAMPISATGAGPLFTKARQAATDFLTSAMVGTKGTSESVGKYSALAMVPTRPLFMELAKHLPSARSYIETKQAMDALRNHWHSVAHTTVEKWSRFARKSADENARLMDLMHESTLAQADPSKPFQSGLSPEDEKALRGRPGDAFDIAVAKKAEDDARRTAWNDLTPRFDALSEPAKRLFEEVRDSYTRMADEGEKQVIDNIRKALEQMVRRAEADHADEMTRIKDEGLTDKEGNDAREAADRKLLTAQTRSRRNRAARLKVMRRDFEANRLQGPYFPLARFGNYFVTVRDADGKVVSFSRFESRRKQRQFADEMRSPAGQKVEESVAAAKGALERNLDPKFVSEVDAILEGANAPGAVRDQIWQKYLETLPDFSVRKNRLHRKGRAGFNRDAVRAFASNMFHGSHQLARLKYGMDLQENIDEARREARDAPDPVRSQALVNEMVLRHDFVMNPQTAPWAQYLSSITFLWTMGANVSSALVNLDQTVTKGIPYLAFDAETKAGLPKATAETLRAMRDFTHGKGGAGESSFLNAEEKSALSAGYDLGVIDKTQAHDIAGVAETGVEYNPTRDAVMRVASWPMHQTERFNREVTFLASYRIARSAGLGPQAAIRKAADLTWMTHFDNQSTSKPRFMQGSVGKVVFSLKSFQANLLYRLARDFDQSMHGASIDERRAAAGRLVSSIMLTTSAAGIKGAPLYSLLMALFGAFLVAGGDDRDPDEVLRKAVLDTAGDGVVGQAVGGMLMDGVPGYLTGTALSGRVGMADMWFRSNDREMTSEQAFTYWLEQGGGATLGLTHKGYRGMEEVRKGNIYRGIEQMMPAAVANVMKAGRYAVDGAQTKDGDDIVEDVPWQDVAKQAIGFTPAEIADRNARNTFQMNFQKRIQDQRSSAIKDAGKARLGNDPAADEKAQKKIDAYNESYPDYAIKPKSVMQAARRQEGKSERKEFGVDLNKKLAPLIKDQTAPSIYSR